MKAQFLRVPDLSEGGLHEGPSHLDDQKGNDQSGHILHPAVAEGMILIRRSLCHLDTDQADDRRGRIGKIVDRIGNHGDAV